MSEINVVKLDQTEHSTISRLFIDGVFVCFILEDGEHANKVHGMTRIPSGRYRLVKVTSGKFFQRYSQQMGHTHVWFLEDVLNFTGILIHAGNRINDTEGCLLPNEYVGFDGVNYFGYNSRSAYKKIYMALSSSGSHIIDVIR